VLQAEVPELVDRACLSQYSSLMGVGEKAHERPRQLVMQRQRPPGEHVRRPRRLGHAQPEPGHEPAREPAREPEREPDPEPDPEPDREPDREPERERE
jgi:hypothetical protein